MRGFGDAPMSCGWPFGGRAKCWTAMTGASQSAVSAEHRIRGQNPRRLQLNASSVSWSKSLHWSLRPSQTKMPRFK